MPIILWLLGVPISVIILLMLFANNELRARQPTGGLLPY